MNDQAAIEDKLKVLKQKYLLSLPDKLAVINALWQDCTEQMSLSDKSLESALHKLAGSAGMYEEQELGQLARDVELIVADCEPDLNDDDLLTIANSLSKLEQKITQLVG